MTIIFDSVYIKARVGDRVCGDVFPVGTTALDALRTLGFASADHISTPCSGKGTCGKCRVRISGSCTAPDAHERSLLGDDAIDAGIRLACLTHITGDTEILLDERSSVAADSIAVAGEREQTYPRTPLSDSFGIAADIGTTTVAVYLVDLARGEIVSTDAFMNPQAEGGADVISRIQYTSETSGGIEKMASLLSNALTASVLRLLSEAHLHPSDVKSAVIAGNTVMEHLLAGIDARSIAVAPFDAPSLFGDFHTPATLHLDGCMAADAKILLAPCVASYVGGDLTAGAIAAGLPSMQGNHLFIDIGTNGEMALLSNGRLTFCATAAGPAFEGAHIECGMSGLAGAVRAVAVTDNPPSLTLSVIGNVAPVGICGSGLIDAVAVFLSLGLIDETGCILSADEVDTTLTRFTDEDGERLTLDKAGAVYLTGSDIREIQLAKSAISSGIMTLLHHQGLTFADIHSVLLAGGFGSKINPDNACAIGLIPAELTGKIRALGNTAGQGAVMLLLSKEARSDAAAVARNSEYLELSCNPFFMEEFVERMLF